MHNMTPDEYKRWYKAQHKQHGNGAAIVAASAAVCVAMFIGAAVLVDHFPKMDSTSKPEATHQPIGNVGGQAPANVRGSYGGGSVAVPTPADTTGNVQSNIDSYNATEQARMASAVEAQQPQATPVPLPLNSAGAPIIDQQQQAQQAQSLNVALDEGMTAADQQLANQRATAYADQAQRKPDVSAQEVATMTGRDPCHVPHADPHTCATGLYKPTPVN